MFIKSSLLSKGMEILADKALTKNNSNYLRFLYNRFFVDKAVLFSNYKDKMTDKFENISNIVLGTSQRKLSDIYVAQSIVDESTNEETVIDSCPIELLRKYKCIVIRDYAGRGKSTLLKRIFIGAVDKGLFPLFVDLRNLNEGGSLMEELLSNLKTINDAFSELLVKSLLRREEFIILLDGFDEVDSEKRNAVVKDINKLILGGDNFFILTSRNDDAIVGFNDFRSFSIKDFTLDQACELIAKYDEYGNDSMHLIQELKDGHHNSVRGFLKSPLHTALFYNVFVGKKGVPYKLYEVCSDIFHSLYNLHDLSKDGCYEHKKKCNLSEGDYTKVIGYIAFWCLKNNKESISNVELSILFDTIRKHYPDLTFDNEDLKTDLIVGLSLFKMQGQEMCWIHDTMSYFFAVCYIRLDNAINRMDLLQSFYKSNNLKNYENMLVMYCELEPGVFRKYFLTQLLDDMHRHYVQLLKYSHGKIPLYSLHARCYYMFMREIIIWKEKTENIITTSSKTKEFAMDILYHMFSEKYLTLNSLSLRPYIAINDRKKQRVGINSFDESQEVYDYVNYLVAEYIDKGLYYLSLDTICNIQEILKNEELITEDSNLLTNI